MLRYNQEGRSVKKQPAQAFAPPLLQLLLTSPIQKMIPSVAFVFISKETEVTCLRGDASGMGIRM